MKKVLFRLSVGLIAIIAIVAIVIIVNEFQSKKSLNVSDLALANIEALASNEGNTKDCPGGYCSRRNSVGEFCDACCPTEKNPKCDSFGCSCE